MLQSIGSQRFGHDGATEQQQQMVDSTWSVSVSFTIERLQRTKYLIAYESKQRITVKKTKLIL